MKIEHKLGFRPIVITLEYQHDADQLLGILEAARKWRHENDALAWAIEKPLRQALTGVVMP